MFNNAFAEAGKVFIALGAVVPSSSTPRRVSLKGYQKCTIIVAVNNATTVTGSAITLKQSQDVAGTGEKALSFTTAKRNIDQGAGDALSDFTVSSDTFTTDATNSKELIYVIEVDPASLDNANGFDVIRAGTANATAATVTVIYLLWGSRFGGALPTARTD